MNTDKPMIKKGGICLLPNEPEKIAWTLTGRGGLSATILSYGGILQKLLVPDTRGELTNVVLGFENPHDYLGEHPYFGAIAGRVAGRISKGELKIKGTSYPLPINDPPHHLHGGPNSIDRQIWNAEPLTDKDCFPSLRLTLTSEDGENGYPGRVELAVTYTVTDDNRLLFETEATSDQLTPVSLTHHSYFNLGGQGSTENHEIQILSSQAFKADEWMGLIGELFEVQSRRGNVGDFVKTLWKNHGDLYWLGESPHVRPVARLHDPASGRVLEVATDCTCLQFYSGVGLDGPRYQPGAGLCFECQGYPNAFDDEKRHGSILVAPGTVQKTRTEYRFSHE